MQTLFASTLKTKEGIHLKTGTREPFEVMEVIAKHEVDKKIDLMNVNALVV